MQLSFRAALLAGAIIFSSGTVCAKPISLADALARGGETSYRLTQAKAQLDAAEARARQAGVSPNPELGLEVENFGGTGPYRGNRSTETTLVISQRLELGGKRSARVEVARAERDFAGLAYVRAGADLARDIRVAHAELRAAEDRAVLARENVARAQELTRTASLLVEVGRDPPLRKLRADALLASARAEEARTFGGLLAAQGLLATLTGVDDPELTAGDDADLLSRDTPNAERPSLDERLAQAERDAALARIRVARAEGVPDITGGIGVRRFNEGRENALIASVSIPIPVRNRNRGGIEAAQSDSIASEANLAQTRLDAARMRRDAAMAVGAADERLAALSGPGLHQAEEAVRLAGIGYRAGKFSLIELIDAQTGLNSARLALIEARLDRARALAALARANTR